jgi:hypothetical protein
MTPEEEEFNLLLICALEWSYEPQSCRIGTHIQINFAERIL